MERIKHEYEWYLHQNNEYIYDDEVIKYLTPRLNDSRSILIDIKETIDNIDLDGNIVNDYLEINEALSMIELLLEMKEYR